MIPPQGSKTKQGYELQLGVNNVAPFLFTKLLTPILVSTANSSPPASTRVVWVSSSAARFLAPDSGVDMNNLDYKVDKFAWHKYGLSKAGNILHAKAFATRFRSDGIVGVVCLRSSIGSIALKTDLSTPRRPFDPGNLKTDLYRNMPSWLAFFVNLRLYDPIFGAYTELFGGLSSTITLETTGAWSESRSYIFENSIENLELISMSFTVEPWGQIKALRADIEKAGESKEDRGSGVGEAFWAWCEEEVRPYISHTSS